MGYGNIGDDTYPLVFNKYLYKHELYFANSDPSPIPDNLDLMIFGGGGLIFDKEGEAHLSYMARYMNHALKLKIPYCFVSVGIQCRRDYQNNKWTRDEYARNWVPFFKKAEFATFRDVGSADYFKDKLKNTDSKCDIYSAPDMCYLYNWDIFNGKRKNITISPCASAKANFPKVKEELDRLLNLYPEAELVSMNMGGDNTDDLAEQVQEIYPNRKVRILLSKMVDPKKAINIINQSHHMITGRYHGLVFCRICNTPYWTAENPQYKIAVENRQSNISDSIKHLKILQNYIKHKV